MDKSASDRLEEDQTREFIEERRKRRRDNPDIYDIDMSYIARLDEARQSGRLDVLIQWLLEVDSPAFMRGERFAERYHRHLEFALGQICTRQGSVAAFRFIRKLLKGRERSARVTNKTTPSARVAIELQSLPYFLEGLSFYAEFLQRNDELEAAAQVRALRDARARNEWPELPQYPPEKREMNSELFWSLIDSTKRDEDGALDQVDLVQRLKACRKISIVKWYKVLQEELTRAHTSEIWEVGYAMNGGLGDDGFEYFKCWLVTQGREFFERFLENPAETALTVSPGVEMDGEWLLEVAQDACAELGADFPETAGVKEEKKRAKLNLVIDEESIPNRYRRIWDHFGGSRGA